jgi:hypothetical protein
MMHANGARLGTPFSDAFVSIQDFAGEIVRKRHTFRERKRANAERVQVAEGMAARIARSAALEHAANLDAKVFMFNSFIHASFVLISAQPQVSPDEDAVSIPSSSDESGVDEPPCNPKVCFYSFLDLSL